MAVWCVWLAVFVVCIGLEAASMALTSIWFAGGALIACVLSIAGVNLYIQMAVFVVVSFLLLYSTRPLALRYINQKTVRTNVDALVGKKARVTAEIDNDEATQRRGDSGHGPPDSGSWLPYLGQAEGNLCGADSFLSGQ